MISPYRMPLTRRAGIATIVLASVGTGFRPALAAAPGGAKFQRVPTQYIAALGDNSANSGTGAQTWGLWPLDPGPRGVALNNFGRLKDAGGVAPAGWKFDATDWWLEEHGLIMEAPDFPLAARKYVVTGDREVTAVLTIHPPDKNGDMRWELDKGASMHDVTHLGCRAARSRPAAGDGSCSPTHVQKTGFPVTPGAAMPVVKGCRQQDYSVLIVVGVGVTG